MQYKRDILEVMLMYSNTRIKKLIGSIEELIKVDSAVDIDLMVLKDDLIKAEIKTDLVIKELTDKITILIAKVDKLEKVPK